jgi:hypothetical protein
VDQRRRSGPAPDDKENQTPGGVGDEDAEPEAHFGDHAEHRERGKPAEIDGDDRASPGRMSRVCKR